MNAKLALPELTRGELVSDAELRDGQVPDYASLLFSSLLTRNLSDAGFGRRPLAAQRVLDIRNASL